MIRKLVFALSLLGVMVAESVFALGIGEATVKSALNQPLKAEIELVSAGEFSAEEILPGLATREEFLKANVDRVYFLSDLRFKVETNAQGKLVVILTSNKPVREPFLNFLVEVIWPSGRLLREYALLIDPPLFSEEPAAPVRAASVDEQSTQSGDVFQIPQAQPETRRSVANPSPRIAGGEYGPTDSNDTLWDIALKARPNRDVSPQQVMLAIQDLNPGAFIQENINKLKAGQVLRLPSMEQIQQRTTHQAIEQVIAQNESVRGKRTKSVASAKAPQADSTQRASVASSSDELKLVVADQPNETASSANSGTSTSGSGSSRDNDPALALTLEKLDKANIENKELNSRVSDLEEQLQTLQRLLTLKNDQLSNIQTQMRANELEKAKALQGQLDKAEMASADSTGETVSPADESVDTSAEMPVESSTDEPASIEGEQTENVSLTQSPDSDPAAIAAAKEATAAASVEPVTPVPDGNRASGKAEKNIIEVIISDTLYLAIAVIAIVVVVFILWLVSRNNAKREEEFQALHGSEDDQIADDFEASDELDEDEQEALDQTIEDQGVEDLVDSEEEFLDEDIFSEDQSDIASTEDEDEDEDVIAEADVYIAYGRLDQASAVLEGAISHDPVRTDLRLKLLEVYKQAGDTDAFNRQFSELEAIQNPEALEQANVIRGDMLDEQLVSLEDKEHELEKDREQHEMDVAQLEAESSIEAEAEALDEEPQAFDFDSVELEESAEADLDADLSLDADLNSDLDAELDLGEADSLVSGSLDEAIDDIADELSSPESEDFDDSILDVDLDDIDLSGELDQETEIQLPTDLTDSTLVDSLAQDEEPQEEPEKPVISDDILEQAAEKLESSQSLDEDLGDGGEFDFLEGTDEASTKLDLARAYIDMGDVEGAKDILEEVKKEGSEEQQAEASDLLNSLNS